MLGNLAEALFLAGEWDEAEELATDGLEHALRTGGQYHEPLFDFVLGELGLVRDRLVRRCGGRAPPRGRPRPRSAATTRPSSRRSRSQPGLLVRTGHDDEAAALVDELLERRRANPTGVMPGYWIDLRWRSTLERIGRHGALAALDEPDGLALPRGRARDRLAAASADAAETLRGDGSAAARGGGARARRARAARRGGRRRGAERSSRGRASCSPRSARTARLRELSSAGRVSRRSGGTRPSSRRVRASRPSRRRRRAVRPGPSPGECSPRSRRAGRSRRS